MIVQRSIYAARNDDVHLRLRVKLTVLDHTKKQQRQRGEDDSRRKKPKGNHHGGEDNANKVNGTGSISTTADTTIGDTEMISSTQGAESKETHPTAEGAAAPGISLQQSSTSTMSGSTGDPFQSTTTATDASAAVESLSSSSTNGHHYSGSKPTVTRQYQLCQYGHPEPGRTIVVRSAILVKIHGDAFGFLSLLGYGYVRFCHRRLFALIRPLSRMSSPTPDALFHLHVVTFDNRFEDEFVRRGYNFMYNNICRISVFRKYKVLFISCQI